jgi:ribokinase
VKLVIITLGERGAALLNNDKSSIVQAYKVKAIDTTAAGDSFIGALASKLQSEDKIEFETIEKAIKFANKVSSIVVQRQGAQPSLPCLKEVLEIYGEE